MITFGVCYGVGFLATFTFGCWVCGKDWRIRNGLAPMPLGRIVCVSAVWPLAIAGAIIASL